MGKVRKIIIAGFAVLTLGGGIAAAVAPLVATGGAVPAAAGPDMTYHGWPGGVLPYRGITGHSLGYL